MKVTKVREHLQPSGNHTATQSTADAHVCPSDLAEKGQNALPHPLIPRVEVCQRTCHRGNEVP